MYKRQAQNIVEIRKEREAARKAKACQDAILRNEERKRQRLLQKLDRVSTDDLVLDINHRAKNNERRECREVLARAADPAPKAKAKGEAAMPKAKSTASGSNPSGA